MYRGSRILFVACIALAMLSSCATCPPKQGPRPTAASGPRWEGFYPPGQITEQWLAGKGIELDVAVARSVLPRTCKLVLHDGPRQASRKKLRTMRQRYCGAPQVRAWNEDRCAALASATACEADSCSYQHFGNCTGFLLGGGVLLTAAHCLATMERKPGLATRSVVLCPRGPGAPPRRLRLGQRTLGKRDFAHQWVALWERNPMDVALVRVEHEALPAWPVGPVPAAGQLVFTSGYPRAEGRSEADRRAHGYQLVFGTPAQSFGRVHDQNSAQRPFCSVDGTQERWSLQQPCPSGKVQQGGQTSYRGVIFHAPFVTTVDTVNGYSGAPVFDGAGRLVGVTVTIMGPVDPQLRYEDLTVGVSARRALQRLGHE